MRNPNTCPYCHRGCGCGCSGYHSKNQSNKTVTVPVAGASFLDEYREFYPEDTRTDKEIIDSQFRPPAEPVADSAIDADIDYSPLQAQSTLEELRALKQSLIDAGYLLPNE